MCEDARIINIVFICDDNYALATGVAISSLKNHRDTSRHYQIFIVANHLSKSNIELLKKLNTTNFQIEIIDATNIASYSSFKRIRTAAHVSPTALYKFNLPEIFENLEKILYLDCDIIIRDSLTGLYDIDLCGQYAAVCEDIGAETYPKPYNRRLKINHEKYFNSGVMLLNLSLLRKDSVTEKLLTYRKKGINHYMDQDALNVVFDERVIFFSFLYNMAITAWQPYPCDVLNKYYRLSLPSKAAFFINAKILHYSSPEKPWKNRLAIGAEEWFSEYIESPFIKCGLLREGDVKSGYRQELNGEIYYPDLVSNRISHLSFNEPPLISVIIPVYNAEKYLGECVESLMGQTLQNAEFIFVDDGSKDSSLDILRLYQKLDSRIQVYTQKNQYAGIARNNGISHATGRYITFLDSDDVMLPDALALLYRRAEITSADIVICSAYRFTTNYEQREAAPWCLRGAYTPMKDTFSPNQCKDTLFQISAGAPWGKLYRRTLLTENGIQFPALPRSEDFSFVYWAFCVANRITTLNAELFLYRIIEGNGSLEDARDHFPLASVKGYSILWNTLGALGKQDDLKKTFVNCIINGIAVHLRNFKTVKAFKDMATCFKNEMIPYYSIDLSALDYFYFKSDAILLRDICSYENVDTFLFQKYRNQPNQGHYKTSCKNEAALIRASASYRIGRFITWIPRKVRGFFRCCREHGWRYTCKRVLVHLHLK